MKNNNDQAEMIIWPETYTRRRLNALYREIPLKDTTSRQLRKYFHAMSNFYGIIPLRKAYRIIHQLSPRLITEDEFWAFAEIAVHECENYYIMGEDELYQDVGKTTLHDSNIIDAFLFVGGDDNYGLTKRSQQGKPYYVPDKKELLKYNDNLYYEQTQEWEDMKAFLEKDAGLSEDDIECAKYTMRMATRYIYLNDASAFDILEEAEIKLKNMKQVEKFTQLFTGLNNNSRMQCNRGYTPKELGSMGWSGEPQSLSLGPGIKEAIKNGEIDVNEFRRDLLNMDVPNEALRFDLLRQLAEIEKSVKQEPKKIKIGRNDPCPCGSGKKYKKCCGR